MPTDEEDEILESLLDRWEDAMEVGQPIDIPDLCAEHPELETLLRAKIERIQKANALMVPSPEPTSHYEADVELAASASAKVETTFDGLTFLSQGGLGQVFVGTDSKLKREVAVKFLKLSQLRSESATARFEHEAEITSRLDHPGIVPIYGVGRTAEGQPFYVMRRLVGKTLREHVREFHQDLSGRFTSQQQVDFRTLLNQFTLICRTLHHSHTRGIIHCDIKPDNIMVGQHGETVVLDWGLAAVVGRDEYHQDTCEQTLEFTEERRPGVATGAGTPAYMSPEQHSGSPLGPASDIYALGAVLYFITTNVAPFDSKQSLANIRSQVIRSEFDTPRSKNPWISPALESIILKAMSCAAEDRYATADLLANDIERYLADEPVTSYDEPFLRRTARWMRRHRSATAMTALLLITSVLGMMGYSAVVSTMVERERTARIAAIEARNQSLRLAANFAARSVAFRMNDRWRILENEASRSNLIQLLTTANSSLEETPWNGLQLLLTSIKENYQSAAGQPDSWFLCDATGRQVARVPTSRRSLGESYQHRDYFHGNGQDLPEGQTGDPPHIDQPHRSKVYISTSTDSLKVALTVPVWSETQASPDQKFLGILGMSVPLGEFSELQTQLGSNQVAMVIDVAENQINGKTWNGLILHHPKQEQSETKLAAISTSMLERILPACEGQFDSSSLAAEDQIIRNFRDPFAANSEHHWTACFSPVMIIGRPDEIAKTRWAVIVAERDMLKQD